MAAVKALLRVISYLYHGLLALLLLAVACLTMASGYHNLHLGMLPWHGSTLTYVLFFGALFGLISLVLAILGKLRFLFLIWALAVPVLLIKGYVLTGYRFSPGEARKAAWITGGSLIALIGAIVQTWGSRSRKRY